MSENVTKTPPIILVPVDFSEYSRVALVWACELARCRHASIVVLHVVHDPADAPGYYQQAQGNVLQPMEDVAAKMMRRFIKATRKGMGDKKLPTRRLKTKLVVGLPVTRILDVAKRVGAAHIVMGSQGRTGLKRLMLGSKAERIVRLAPLPVTIVPAPKK